MAEILAAGRLSFSVQETRYRPYSASLELKTSLRVRGYRYRRHLIAFRYSVFFDRGRKSMVIGTLDLTVVVVSA